MAGFKKINGANPTVRRPLRMSDIQDLWDGMNSLFGLSLNPDVVWILSGCELDEDNTVKSGVLLYNNQLFLLDANPFVGDRLFLCEKPDATRTFSDGQPQVFSYSYEATTTAEGNVLMEMVITEDWLRNYRVIKGVEDGSITTPKLANDAVTSRKIQGGASMRTYGGVISSPYDGDITLPRRDSFYRLRTQSTGTVRFYILDDMPYGRSVTYDIIVTNYGQNSISPTIYVNFSGVEGQLTVNLNPETTSLVRVVASVGDDSDLLIYSQQISVNPL